VIRGPRKLRGTVRDIAIALSSFPLSRKLEKYTVSFAMYYTTMYGGRGQSAA